MDKEQSGNLDDILKELKSKMENADNASSEISSQDDIPAAEPISAELLKERLREQFMSDGEQDENEKEADEYTIDNDLISEFYEEASNNEENIEESDVADEPAETEEVAPVEAEEGEIVEIIIPWVEKIEENSDKEPEEEPEDFGGELNEDYFDAEAAENSYVCFADDEGSDDEFFEDEEEFFEQDEELEGETDDIDEDGLPWYEDNIPTSTIVNTDAEEPAVEEALPQEAKEPKEEAFEETDELIELEAIEPIEAIEELEALDGAEDISYADESDADELLQEESFDEESFAEEMQTLEKEPYEIILPISADEYDEDEDYVDLFMDAVEEEDSPLFGEKSGDEYAEQMQIGDLWSIEKARNEQAAARKALEEEEGDSSSFYRMIIEEREKRETEYGYFTDRSTDDEKASDEVEIPHWSDDATVSPKDEAVKSSDDFYAADEQAASFIPQKPQDNFDYDHEETHTEATSETETNVVWRKAKPILLSALALAILILELIPVFEIIPDGIFDYTSYPWTYIFIDAQLLVFAAAICYRKLFEGLRKLFTSEADIYSVLSMTVIVTLLSSILSGFEVGALRLYNSVSAIYLLSVYLLERFDKRRIRESLELLSDEAVFTLKRSQGKNSCAEKMYAGGLDPDTSILEPVEIENEGFESVFSRERIWKKKAFSNNLILSSAIPVTVFSIFVAMVSVVISADLATTVNAFVFTFVLLAPLSATVAYYLPILISSLRLSKRGCFIAGYDGAAAIADCDAVVFSDGHLFKDCEASEAGIKLYCDESKTRDLFVCLGAVYSRLGGPMQNTFAAILGDEEHRVSMTRITRNGFEAVVDNRANIIVGSSDYLARYGIITDRADTKEQGVIYAAMNSSLCAKISVKYKTQPLFEALSAILDEYRVKSVVQTYDPIISGKYVAKCREAYTSPISVVHKNIGDFSLGEKRKAALGKAGAFATSSRLKLVELLTFCKRITQIRRINAALLIASYSVAAISCILLSLVGGFEEMNLLGALLYQAAFIALSTFATVRLLPLSFEGIQKKKAQKELKK